MAPANTITNERQSILPPDGARRTSCNPYTPIRDRPHDTSPVTNRKLPSKCMDLRYETNMHTEQNDNPKQDRRPPIRQLDNFEG